MDTTTRDLLATWGTLLLAELALVLWVEPGFPPLKIAAEVGGIGVLAASHAVLAKQDWMRSVVWPPLAMVVLSVWAVGLPVPAEAMVLVVPLTLAALWWLASWAPIRQYGLGIGVVLALSSVPLGRVLLLTTALKDRTPDGATPTGVSGMLDEIRPLPTLPPVTSDGPPLVVITIDTLQWQRMAKMPTVRRIADRGLYWDQAMSTSSWTMPALASVQTGLPPSEHGAAAQIGGAYQGLSDDVTTLPELLSEAGYRTHGITTNGWLSEQMGFTRGFQRYEFTPMYTPQRLMLAGYGTDKPSYRADVVTDRALAALDELPDRGAYLWVHYVEPHLPFELGEPPAWLAGKADIPARLASVSDRQGALTSYQDQIDYLDTELARLLDAMDARGWDKEAVVVITADHGEEFWEHGNLGHGHSHHGEVIDVGLAISGPGFDAGREGTGLASLTDVPVTLLAAAGVPAADMTGQDLRSLPTDRVVTAWGNLRLQVQASARDAQWRVILDADCTLRAYDLEADPTAQQARWLGPDHRVVQAVLGASGPMIESGGSEVSAELAALGYVVGETDGSDPWPACDADDMRVIGELEAPAAPVEVTDGAGDVEAPQ